MVGTINFRKSIHKKEEVYKRFPFFFTYGMSFPFPLFFCENFIFLFDAKKKIRVEKTSRNGQSFLRWDVAISSIVQDNFIQHAGRHRKLMQFSLTTQRANVSG